uniref:TauD/TfdA-like domain-containing protein n=2 Tax=Arion vulgaris TaxID=1028688 RepID=A0A0B6ZCM7_9EUPU
MISEVTYIPAKLGMQVRGIDLKNNLTSETIANIKDNVQKHRLLIFKNQGIISCDRHVEISKWFGEMESTFYRHPKSQHPDVFRVSNDEKEGCRNVGRTGWHIDGSFMDKPFNYALYHMVSVPKVGCTAFVGFKELLKSLKPERRAAWDRLWMLGDNREVIHPLIYKHPVTKATVMCFHLGMIACFMWDYRSQNQRVTHENETAQLLQEIHTEIVKDNERLIYKHHWEEGDFIISDNRAVAHEATPETQYPVSQVGLRVLHRTTVAGTTKPEKSDHIEVFN